MPRKKLELLEGEIIDWQTFATAKNWKRKLTIRSRRGGLPKATWDACEIWFPYLLKSSGKTPDELIEAALIDPDVGEEAISDAFMYAKELGQAHNSAIIGIHGSVRGFFSHNKVNTHRWHTPEKETNQVELTDANYPTFLVNKTTKKLELNRPLLQSFYKHLNFRDEVIADCLISAGLDSGDLLKLNLAFVRNQDPSHKRLYVGDSRNKTGKLIKVFFSVGATKNIRKYVKNERLDGDDTDPIFVTLLADRKKSFRSRYGREYTNLDFEDLPKAKPLRRTILSENFRDATEKTIKTKLPAGSQSPLRPKRLRHIFRSACQLAGIGDDLTRLFMGTSSKSSRGYLPKSREELEVLYEPTEIYTNVYFDGLNDEKFKLEKDFAEYKKETDAKIDTLSRKYRDAVTQPIDDDITNKRIEKILKKHKII